MKSEKLQLIYDSDYYWDKFWSKIDKAEKSIFIITYDMDNKMNANITIQKLMDALDRGVKVVLLVEHLNFYLKHSLCKQLKQKGAIILSPNPMERIITHIADLNIKKFFNRSHQKVSLIDNDLFVGSINMSNEYTNVRYGSFKFIDLNIYVKNTVCRNRVIRFFKEIIEEEIEQIPSNKNKTKLMESVKETFSSIDTHEETGSSTPDNKTSICEEFLEERPPELSEIQDNLFDLLDSSKESIVIVQPYYNNLKKLEDKLIDAVKRGVRVQIITAEKRDQVAYAPVYNSDLFKKLLENGVEVYEFLDKFLHMKAFYVDRTTLSLGSMNLDRTSFVMNNEANYLVNRSDSTANVFEDFERMIAQLHTNCRKVDLYSYKNPIRLAWSYWWYFFVWCMEKTVQNRKPKYFD